MAEQPIQNCEVRFQFKCPKQWDALQETADARVRSCSQCQKPVYLCQSVQEVAQHAQQGHCIAVPAGLTSAGKPVLDLELLKLVGRELARKFSLMPVGRSGSTLILAMSDPTDSRAIDEVRFYTGYNVEAVAASREDILEALDRVEQGPVVELGVVDERSLQEPEEPGVQLYLVSSKGETRRVTGHRFTIGRSEENDFKPDSGLISRRHAVILREGDDYFIEDLASTSGIWINQARPDARHKLSEGDEIQLADVKLRVHFRR